MGNRLVIQLPSDIRCIFAPEIRQIRNGQRRWPTPLAICPLLSRLGVIPYCTTILAYCRGLGNCTVDSRSSTSFVALGILTSQFIFTIRAEAVATVTHLRISRLLIGFMWVGNLALFALWVTFIATSKIPTFAQRVPPIEIGVKCGKPQIQSAVMTSIPCLALVLDLVLVILMIVSLYPRRVRVDQTSLPAPNTHSSLGFQRGKRAFVSPVGRKMLIDSLWYFALAASVEICGIIVSVFYLDVPNRFNPVRAALFLSIHATMGYSIAPRCITSLRRRGTAYSFSSTSASRRPNASNASNGDSRPLPPDMCCANTLEQTVIERWEQDGEEICSAVILIPTEAQLSTWPISIHLPPSTKLVQVRARTIQLVTTSWYPPPSWSIAVMDKLPTMEPALRAARPTDPVEHFLPHQPSEEASESLRSLHDPSLSPEDVEAQVRRPELGRIRLPGIDITTTIHQFVSS